MKLLLIGDVVGRPGRRIVERTLLALRDEHNIDLAVANCENAAGGVGVTASTAKELFSAGIDVLTSGNHVWRKREARDLLELNHRVIRPANYPAGAPGTGSTVIEARSGEKVGVLNLMGRIFMEPLECPFRTADKELARLRLVTPVVVVDMHAEATSEKVAMGWYLDGKVSCVFGTHTHVPTADERILPGGTAVITDVGMTGPYDSVIGRRVEQILERFLSSLPVKSDVADQNVQLWGLVVEIDSKTGRAISVERITRTSNDIIESAGN